MCVCVCVCHGPEHCGQCVLSRLCGVQSTARERVWVRVRVRGRSHSTQNDHGTWILVRFYMFNLVLVCIFSYGRPSNGVIIVSELRTSFFFMFSFCLAVSDKLIF